MPIADIGFRGRQIKCYVVRSTPNLSDLIIDCAAKFLRYALNLLPRICAILAFEREDIDYPKQAKSVYLQNYPTSLKQWTGSLRETFGFRSRDCRE